MKRFAPLLALLGLTLLVVPAQACSYGFGFGGYAYHAPAFTFVQPFQVTYAVPVVAQVQYAQPTYAVAVAPCAQVATATATPAAFTATPATYGTETVAAPAASYGVSVAAAPVYASSFYGTSYGVFRSRAFYGFSRFDRFGFDRFDRFGFGTGVRVRAPGVTVAVGGPRVVRHREVTRVRR